LEELEQEIEQRGDSDRLHHPQSSVNKADLPDSIPNPELPGPVESDGAAEDWQLMGLLQGLEGRKQERQSLAERFKKAPGVETAVQVPRPWAPSETKLTFSIASDANSGFRSYMEDGSVVLQPLPEVPGDNWAFFGVYDGHGGREAVDYCEMRLHEQVSLEMKSSGPAEALKTAFLKIDSQLGMYGAWNHGTTATVVLVESKAGKGTQRTLHVAHVGDSRAVLIENISCPRSLTKDHRPTDPAEAKQVTQGGGIVSGGRVGGDLAISRSLGDHRLKGKGLSCTPDLCTASAAAGHILIVATDGLWDVVTDEEACNIVEKSVENAAEEKHGPADIAAWLQERASQELVDEAKRRGSRDNILVLTLFF